VTTRNVSVATNAFGTPVAASSLNARDSRQIAELGLLTGAGGSNSALLQHNFQFIGGDTELLANVEYRIPLFGPATLAVFSDIGSAFNIRNTGTQTINSQFLSDDTFVGTGVVTALALRNNPQLENSFGSLLYFNNRLMTQTDFLNEFCTQRNRLSCPIALPNIVSQFFVRGEAQKNSLLRVDQARFDTIKDYRSSVGLELRVQVPIVNVPFRLIYYYNPNAKLGYTAEAPLVFLPGKRSGFKFTVGRTF
jgi:outer membrane protein insertion porin family